MATAQTAQVSQNSDEIIGDWHLVQTLCNNFKTNRAETTRIMKVPWFGFEPNVQLRIYEKFGGKNIEKVIPNSSCEGNPVQTTHFIRSTYSVRTETVIVNNQRIHRATSRGIIEKNVNEQALKQCGGRVKGFILNTIVSNFIYPDYFEQESRRRYDFYIRGGRLFMIFSEPMICETGQTVMIFNPSR